MTCTRFVVVGSQRTGSTLIRTSLDSHPSIKCSGEIFLFPGDGEESYPRYLRQAAGRRIMHYLWRRKPVFDFLDALYAREGYQALGFKFMYSQATRSGTPMVLDYVRRHNIRVIHVIRQNALKTLISRMSARKTGIYHSTGEKVRREKVLLPPDRLLRDLDHIRRLDAIWQKKLSRTPYLQVAYEDFVEEPEQWSERMLEFLGNSDIRTLCSPHRKVNPDSLEQIIANYDQVCDLLENTPYRSCLA